MCVKRFLKVFSVDIVAQRNFYMASYLNKVFNKPPSANELPRPAGISSMFRLPIVTSTEGNVLDYALSFAIWRGNQ